MQESPPMSRSPVCGSSSTLRAAPRPQMSWQVRMQECARFVSSDAWCLSGVRKDSVVQKPQLAASSKHARAPCLFWRGTGDLRAPVGDCHFFPRLPAWPGQPFSQQQDLATTGARNDASGQKDGKAPGSSDQMGPRRPRTSLRPSAGT